MCNQEQYKRYIVDRIQNDVGKNISARIYRRAGREATPKEMMVTKETIRGILDIYLKTNRGKNTVDYSKILGVGVEESMLVQKCIEEYDLGGYLKEIYKEESIRDQRVSMYALLIGNQESYIELHYKTEAERDKAEEEVKSKGLKEHLKEKQEEGNIIISDRWVTQKRGWVQKRYIKNKEEIVSYKEIKG